MLNFSQHSQTNVYTGRKYPPKNKNKNSDQFFSFKTNRVTRWWVFSCLLLEEDAASACWHVLSWQGLGKALPQHSQALEHAWTPHLLLLQTALNRQTLTDRQDSDRSGTQKSLCQVVEAAPYRLSHAPHGWSTELNGGITL